MKKPTIPNFGKKDPFKGYESSFQKSAIRLIRLKYPKCISYHVANGGTRSAKEGHSLKLQGVLPGVPDICIDTPANNYHGARIELKTNNGKLSDKQLNILTQMQKNGYYVSVCWNIDAVEKSLTEYFGR